MTKRYTWPKGKAQKTTRANSAPKLQARKPRMRADRAIVAHMAARANANR